MQFNYVFDDFFATANVKSIVDGHTLYITVFHQLEDEEYQAYGRDMYHVCFTVDTEEDIRKINIESRKTKVAICRELKVMWAKLIEYVIEMFGEDVGFFCQAYDGDGHGAQRTINYVKQGFTPQGDKLVHLPY